MARVLGLWWCRWRNHRIMWPINGSYICGECGRRHLVPEGVK